MIYDPHLHHRHSIRLKDYDYTQAGVYFVTICTWQHECLFGEVVEEIMVNNYAGSIVQAGWQGLPKHYKNIGLDAFVIMPNHVHAIILLHDMGVIVGAGLPNNQLSTAIHPKPAPTIHGLPEIVRAFKTFSARRINALRRLAGVPVWQRNYYEHIIRNEIEYSLIFDYIQNNPACWLEDQIHPNAPPNPFK